MANVEITFILGGAGSGKSLFAENLTAGRESVAYIATAKAEDAEMEAKIKEHRDRRPTAWRTVKCKTGDLPNILAKVKESLVIIDSLTLYTAELLEHKLDPVFHMRKAAGVMRRRDADLIIVSDEVGSGLIPTTGIGRRFREILGAVNRLIASEADNVYLVVAGLPVTLKGKHIQRSDRWA